MLKGAPKTNLLQPAGGNSKIGKKETGKREKRAEFGTVDLKLHVSLCAESRTMANPRNMIGPQLRRLRVERKLSQPRFAALCQRNGWDLSRDTLAKIEAQTRWVSDFELVFLAEMMEVPIEFLLPSHNPVIIAKEFVVRLEHKVG